MLQYNFMRLLFKLLLFIVFFLLLGLFGISISRKLPRITGHFSFLTSVPTAFVAALLIALLLFQFARTESFAEKKAAEMPIKELNAMLYLIEDVRGSGQKITNQARSIAKGILPYLQKIISYHRSFLHELPPEVRVGFYTIYKSITGKHGHYWEKRLMDDVKKLEGDLLKIVEPYKRKFNYVTK